MNIRLAIDPARARLWQRDLAAGLRSHGHQVSIALRREGPPLPRAIGWLLALERLAYGRRPTSPGAEWQSEDLAAEASIAGEADLEIDLTGHRPALDGRRTLRPVYGNALVEDAAISELLNGRIPAIGVSDSEAPHAPLMTRPAVEDPLSLSRALDNLGTRMASLLMRAVELADRGQTTSGPAMLPTRDVTNWAAGGTFGALGRKAQHVLNRMMARAPHWHVGWRRPRGDLVRETLSMPHGGWSRLPDDGSRFFADPFLIEVGGRIWMFVEEFPYATGKGIISALEMNEAGPVGTPRPALDLPYHLSYPNVFERDGQIWMIPESASSGRIELWRADEFPFRWSHAANLVENIVAGDATLAELDGRLWLFASVGGHGASTWDALHLWSSERLMGPWQPHAANPVVLDARSARPGGAMYRHDGALWRPAQDCSTGYGAGLSLCRVMRLDDEAFEQSVEATLRPNADWPGAGLHTLNVGGGFEAVDGCRARGS